MTNYEYMKTLSKDEMAEFIMGTMSEAFNIITKKPQESPLPLGMGSTSRY